MDIDDMAGRHVTALSSLRQSLALAAASLVGASVAFGIAAQASDPGVPDPTTSAVDTSDP